MGDNDLIGRCDRIRTYDPFTPSEVRYQAALHTDRAAHFTEFNFVCNAKSSQFELVAHSLAKICYLM